MIQIGVCEWALPMTGPFAVRLAAEIGFDGLQLGDCGGKKMAYPLNHRRVQQEYLQAAETAGVSFHSIHTRTMYQEKTIYASKGTPDSDRARMDILSAVTAAVDMKVPVVMISGFIGAGDEEVFRNVADNLSYACSLGAEKGIVIAFESNLSNDDIFRMRERTGTGLKVCFDTCNPYIYDSGEAPEMLADMMATDPEIIDHYHVKDTRREEFLIGRPAPILMGKGDSRIQESADIVLATGFDGWVISESYYYAEPINQGGDFMQIAAEDCAAIRNIFKRKV